METGFKECLVNQCWPSGRERTCPGSGTLASTRLSIPLKWTNHIDCLWARLQILIWLGGLPGTQALLLLTVETDLTSNQRRMPGSLYAVVYVVLSIHMFCRQSDKDTKSKVWKQERYAEINSAWWEANQFAAVFVPNHTETSCKTVVAWVRLRWCNGCSLRTHWRWAGGKEASSTSLPGWQLIKARSQTTQIRWNLF